jgi:hypothetical protein
VKATVKRPGNRHRLEAWQHRGNWNDLRQSFEHRDLVTDADTDYYLQEWRNRRTGRVTWRKQGKLSDPTTHGRLSFQPSSPADRGVV